MEAGERMFRVREWLTGMSKGSGEAPSDKMCCGFLDAPVSRYCDLGTPHSRLREVLFCCCLKTINPI